MLMAALMLVAPAGMVGVVLMLMAALMLVAAAGMVGVVLRLMAALVLVATAGMVGVVLMLMAALMLVAAAGMVGVVLRLMMVVSVMVMMVLATEHPEDAERQPHHEKAGHQHQPRLSALEDELVPEIQAEQGQAPDHDRVARRRYAEQGRLGGCPSNGNDEPGHQGLGVARLEGVERTKQDSERKVEPGVCNPALDDAGDIGHKSLLEPCWDARRI
jgi:hypothetical protein